MKQVNIITFISSVIIVTVKLVFFYYYCYILFGVLNDTVSLFSKQVHSSI